MSNLWDNLEFLALPLINVCSFISTKDIMHLSKVNKVIHTQVSSDNFLRQLAGFKCKKQSSLISKSELLNLLFLLDNEGRFGFRQMDIAWVDNASYWRANSNDPESYFNEVAELVNVCWLYSSLHYTNAPRGVYEVIWRLKKETTTRFNIDFYAKTKKHGEHDTTAFEVLFNVNTLPKQTWEEIKIGQVIVTEKGTNLEVGFFNTDGNWKQGLVIDYVELKWISDPPSPSV